MAPNSCLYDSPQYNLFINLVDYELAGNLSRVRTKSSGSLTPTFQVFLCGLLPVFTLALALTSFFTNNELFKQFKTAYLVA